jgi:hypothetical protein
MKAPGILASLSRMEQLSKEPNFYSGAGGDLVLEGKKIMSAISGDPGLAASGEGFAGISNQVVLAKIGSLGTGISNADRSFIEGIAPRMNNTPAGNKIMIHTLRKMAERDQDIAKFASEYRKSHKGQLDEDFPIALGMWAEEHPVFTAADAPDVVGAGAPPPSSTADGSGVIDGVTIRRRSSQ